MDDPRVPTALALLTALDLPADEATVLHASNTLTLRVLPCDVVARIAPHDRAEELAIELERAEALQAVGAPVGPPDPRLAPSVHMRGEHAITLWEHLPVRDRTELPPTELAAALAALHAGMRALDLPVAPLADRVGHALDLLRDRERTPALALEDRALLQETLSRRGCRTPSGPRPGAAREVPHPLARARDDLALGSGGHLPGRPSDRRGVAGRGAGARRGVRPRDRGPSSRIPCPGMVGGFSPSSRRILR